MTAQPQPRTEEQVPETLTDEEVVRRILAGESALFKLIMRRYNQRLYRVVRSVLRDDDEAEDAVQQAYVNAYLHLGQFGGRARFATWLTKIAVYEAYSRARRRDRYTNLESAEMESRLPGETGDRMMSANPDPERLVATAELRELLEKLIDSLPSNYRTVFVLREVEGLSTIETAECLGISPEAVKVHLHRGKATLRKELHAQAGLATSSAFPFLGARCDRIVQGVFTRLNLPLPEAPGGRASD